MKKNPKRMMEIEPNTKNKMLIFQLMMMNMEKDYLAKVIQIVLFSIKKAYQLKQKYINVQFGKILILI